MWEKGTGGELFDTTFLAQAIHAPVPQNKLCSTSSSSPCRTEADGGLCYICTLHVENAAMPTSSGTIPISMLGASPTAIPVKTSSTHTLKLKETFLYALSRLSNTYVDCFFFSFLSVHRSIILRHAYISTYTSILARMQGINY
jgi:hypothetical protein